LLNEGARAGRSQKVNEFPAAATMRACQTPVFVANGDSDPMILPHYSHLRPDLHAQVKIYPSAAHGFLFQHHAEFALVCALAQTRARPG
jgi:hypothetical protein